jgi:signal transduction histidine kinase
MTGILNLDLLSVGLAIAGMAILAFIVFFNNRKSVTNQTFLLLAFAVIGWSIVNYLSYKLGSPQWSLFFLRSEMFFAVWFAFLIFRLLYVFPKESFVFSRIQTSIILPFVTIISISTLTSFVFPAISGVSQNSIPVAIINLPGIIIFGITVMLFNVIGIVILIKKTIIASGIEKKQFRTVLMGVMITLVLIIIFNFILPAFFNNQRFVPLAALFVFPFIVFTYYAIVKQKLLNVKVISTEILAFALVIVTFSEIIFSQSLVEILFRIGEFILVLVFGILLIQSVLREVEQREELQRLNDKLDAANKQLEELSHFKSELLSLASHQIRSPLAAIKGFGTLITTGAYGPVPDVIKAKVEQMSKSADSLISLINTLLDMRKVDEGKMDYQMARADLNKIVNDVVDLMKPLAETKKLEFKFDSPGHEIPVNADAEKLKQVIQNLTDNAIKYTPAGFVHLELKEEPSTTPGQAPVAIVTVSDSGVGFAPDLAPHLFEEFIRDARVKKQILGTGLGLYIARKIAEAHGGTVWAESAGEGKGSAFHVKVPEVK